MGLSKTAKASMRTETGGVARTPVAWIFRQRVGVWQTRPYLTSYKAGEAEAFLEENPEGFFMVKWAEQRRR